MSDRPSRSRAGESLSFDFTSLPFPKNDERETPTLKPRSPPAARTEGSSNLDAANSAQDGTEKTPTNSSPPSPPLLRGDRSNTASAGEPVWVPATPAFGEGPTPARDEAPASTIGASKGEPASGPAREERKIYTVAQLG